MCGIRLWSFVEKIHNRAGRIPEVHTDEVSNQQNTPAAHRCDRGVLYKKNFRFVYVSSCGLLLDIRFFQTVVVLLV